MKRKKLAADLLPHVLAAVQQRREQSAKLAAEQAFGVDLDEEEEPEQRTRLQPGTIVQNNRSKIISGVVAGVTLGIALALFSATRSQENVTLNVGLCSKGGLKNCLGQVKRNEKIAWDLTFLKVGSTQINLGDAISQQQATFMMDCSRHQLTFVGYGTLGDYRLNFKPETSLAHLPQSLQVRITADVCPLPADIQSTNHES